jgi:hypothetical protein
MKKELLKLGLCFALFLIALPMKTSGKTVTLSAGSFDKNTYINGFGWVDKAKYVSYYAYGVYTNNAIMDKNRNFRIPVLNNSIVSGSFNLVFGCNPNYRIKQIRMYEDTKGNVTNYYPCACSKTFRSCDYGKYGYEMREAGCSMDFFYTYKFDATNYTLTWDGRKKPFYVKCKDNDYHQFVGFYVYNYFGHGETMEFENVDITLIHVDSAAFEKPSYSVEKSKTVQPKLSYTSGYNGTITYSSSNTSVATVNSKTGVVTAVKPGKTVITATLSETGDYMGTTATTTVYVYNTYTPSFAESSITCTTWDLIKNTLLGVPSDYDGKITYSSDNTSVASINGTAGDVWVKGYKGTANITATLTETDYAKFTNTKPSYTVNVPVQSISEGVYMIPDTTTLIRFAKLVNGGITKFNVKQTADIDFSEYSAKYGWKTIDGFEGKYDGQGYTIKNFNQGQADQKAYPLFGTLKGGATITDLNMDNAFVFIQADGLGCMARVNNGTITRCVVTNSTIESGAQDNLGGIVGINNGTVSSCALINSSITKRYGGANNKSFGGIVCTNNYTANLCRCFTYGCKFTSGNSASSSICSSNSGYSSNNCSDTDLNVGSDNKLATKQQFANGYVLSILNSYDWAQTLWTDIYPVIYWSKNICQNYVYYKDGWVSDDFAFTDGNSVDLGISFTAAKLSYDRQFTVSTASDRQLYTVFAPFIIPSEGNGTFYTCSGVSDNSATLAAISGSTSANTAYIFEPSAASMTFGSNVQVKATTDVDQSSSKLKGVYSPFTFTADNKAGCYGYAASTIDGFTAGEFVKVGAGATVAPMRAYLYAPASNSAKLDVIFSDGDGTVTGIGTVDSNGVTKLSGAVYNIQGMKVSDSVSDWNKLPRGVYVVGGQKVIKK